MTDSVIVCFQVLKCSKFLILLFFTVTVLGKKPTGQVTSPTDELASRLGTPSHDEIKSHFNGLKNQEEAELFLITEETNAAIANNNYKFPLFFLFFF